MQDDNEIRQLLALAPGEPALATIGQRLAERPGDAGLLYAGASQHDSLGLESQAVALYEQALAAGLSGSHRVDACLGLGSTLRALGRYDEAAALLTRASREYPDAVELRVFLAMTDYNRGAAHQAVAALLQVLAVDCRNPRIQRYARAISHYAADLDATSPN